MNDSLLALEEEVADGSPVKVDRRLFLANGLLFVIYCGNLPEDSRTQVSGIEARARGQKMSLKEAVDILDGREGIATLPMYMVGIYIPPSGVKCKKGVVYLIPEKSF